MSSSSSGPTMMALLGSSMGKVIAGEGAFIRHRAFIRGERVIQTLHLKGGPY